MNLVYDPDALEKAIKAFLSDASNWTPCVPMESNKYIEGIRKLARSPLRPSQRVVSVKPSGRAVYDYVNASGPTPFYGMIPRKQVEPSPIAGASKFIKATLNGQELDYCLAANPDKGEAIIAEVQWDPLNKQGSPIADPDSPYGYKTIVVKGKIEEIKVQGGPFINPDTGQNRRTPQPVSPAAPLCDMCGNYHYYSEECYWGD